MLRIVCLLACILSVFGHGFLRDPPARNAMWKYGYRGAPTNYDLTANYCGGVGVQYGKNGGKCGICGDAYNQRSPRRHEVGGRMYDGRITGTYKSGEVIELKVSINANHQGWFQFKLCPTVANPTKEVTQECLDQNILDVVGRNDQKHHITYKDGRGIFKVKVQLPQGLTCDRCVLQWRYHVANSWGCDRTGCGMGKGNQEEFINCADIKIE